MTAIAKRFNEIPRAAVLACGMVIMAGTAAAQQGKASAAEIRAEISEAMEAIAAYSAQERDEAMAEARAALTRIDAEIERREQALRENWADMSDAARDSAQARLRDLRAARNRLGERYGALEAGTAGAWDELKTGFSDAWNAFSDAWTAADEDTPAN